ncbi:MAG: DUF2846 domain-containing protein [Haliea sp.]|nr:DUF2846 domain-containing protein [Haliea sp.]
MRTFISVLIAVLLTACAASGPQYSAHKATTAEAAVIYVYRPSRAVNCCVAPVVYLDDARRGDLKNGGYLVFEVPAGKHAVQVGDGTHGFDAQVQEFQAEAGKSYYLKWVIGSIEDAGVFIVGSVSAAYATRNYHLVLVPQDAATTELAELKLSDA